MENNNIDDFFRQHSHTMDETPGDALWQRIEPQLPAVSYIQPKGKTNFSWSKLLLALMVTATAIVTGIVFMRNNSEKVLQPAVVLPTPSVVSETATEQDTVKPKKPVKNTTKTAQALPFRPIKKLINNQEEVTDLSITDSEQIALKTQPVPEPKVIKTTTAYHPKRTIVTVNEKVNQDVFDSITKSNIEKYKNHAGMQLIVKEPRSGYLFRTKFELQMVTYMLTGTDTIKSINTLNQEVITFKTDTLKTVAPAGVMSRYYIQNKKDGEKPKKQP